MVGLFTLTGCQTNGGNLKNRISFEIDNQYWPKHSIVYKNNWPECGNLTLTPEAIKKKNILQPTVVVRYPLRVMFPNKLLLNMHPG